MNTQSVKYVLGLLSVRSLPPDHVQICGGEVLLILDDLQCSGEEQIPSSDYLVATSAVAGLLGRSEQGEEQ